MKRIGLVTLLGVSCIGGVAQAEEIYKATITSGGAFRSVTSEITLTIESQTTDEESAKLQQILQEEGSDAAIEAVREFDHGVARIEGTVPRRIVLMRVHEGQNGRQIIIITDQPLYAPGQTPDPDLPRKDAVGFIQLAMNNQGQGRGRMAEAMGITMTDEGVFQVEASGAKPIEIEDARRVE
jgi:hypothetical protein